MKPDRGVKLPKTDKVAAWLVIPCLLSAFLVSCSPATPTETVQATINITKIVDTVTKQPINSNIVTLRWETTEGKVLKVEQHRNQSQLTTAMPADGSIRLFVIVEALGYEKWENVIRMKFNTDKPVSFPVVMERVKGLQG